jgi:hypothetical protein
MRRVDADQRCRIVRHDGHPCWYDRATMTFVGDAGSSTAPQAGNEAFHHRSAIATRVSEIHLAGGPCLRQAVLVQKTPDVLRRGRRGERLDRCWDPYGENPLLVQHLTQGGSMERPIAGQRVDGGGGACRDPGDGVLHIVNQGLHRTGITGFPHGPMPGEDEASGWLGDNPWLAAELGGAIAFAFANGRNGGVVGVDDFAVGQRFALRESTGLGGDLLMRLDGCRKLDVQARPLILRQRLTRLLTCSMRTRRRAMRRLAAFWRCVRARPRGLRVGMITSTCGRVNARKPRSWSNRLPAGQGDGVASAIRLSWVRPSEVSLRKRMVSTALISSTLLTVWHFFLPR